MYHLVKLVRTDEPAAVDTFRPIDYPVTMNIDALGTRTTTTTTGLPQGGRV